MARLSVYQTMCDDHDTTDGPDLWERLRQPSASWRRDLGLHSAASESHVRERISLQHTLQQRIQLSFVVDDLDLG